MLPVIACLLVLLLLPAVSLLQLFAPQLQPTGQLLHPLEQRQQALLQGSGLSCAHITNPSALLCLPVPLPYLLVLLRLLLLLLLLQRTSAIAVAYASCYCVLLLAVSLPSCSCLRRSCSQLPSYCAP
jgi:hypothetical protein